MISLDVTLPRSVDVSVRIDMREFVSLFVVAFCATMLAAGKAEGVYLPVLAGVVGYWMPSPADVFDAIGASDRESVGSVAPAPAEADDDVEILDGPAERASERE
jgi:hypothetical protein